VKGETTVDNPRWGWFVPTKKLFNSFDADDVRRGVTIAREADSINANPRDSVNGKIDNVKGWYIVAKLPDPVTGFQNFKYEIGKYNSLYETDNGFQGNPLNIYYIRYADVILMAAEAAMMLNDQTNASKYFNMIRERARNCGDGIHPADLTGAVTNRKLWTNAPENLLWKANVSSIWCVGRKLIMLLMILVWIGGMLIALVVA